jgi:hypothetical protein
VAVQPARETYHRRPPGRSSFPLHRLTETGELLYLKNVPVTPGLATTTRTNAFTPVAHWQSICQQYGSDSGSAWYLMGVGCGVRIPELAGLRRSITLTGNRLARDARGRRHYGGHGRNTAARHGLLYKLKAWDFSNDEAEMSAGFARPAVSITRTAPLAAGILMTTVPGDQWEWFGDTAISQTEDYKFDFTTAIPVFGTRS